MLDEARTADSRVEAHQCPGEAPCDECLRLRCSLSATMLAMPRNPSRRIMREGDENSFIETTPASKPNS